MRRRPHEEFAARIQETRLAPARDGVFDLTGGDALKAAVHRNDAHRTIESPGERGQAAGTQYHQRGTARVAAPLDPSAKPLPPRLLGLGFVLESIAAHQP